MGLGTGAGFVLVYIVVLIVCFFVVRKGVRGCRQQEWCPKCKTYVSATTSKTNVSANILLSILTLGIWLMVWACTADLSAKCAPRCTACGEPIQEAEAGESREAHPTEP